MVDGINWRALAISIVRLKHFSVWWIFNETEVNPVSDLVLRGVGGVVSGATSGVCSCHCARREGIRGGGRSPLVPKFEAWWRWMTVFLPRPLICVTAGRIWKLCRGDDAIAPAGSCASILAYAACSLVSTPITVSRFLSHLWYSIRVMDLWIFTSAVLSLHQALVLLSSHVPEKSGRK